jgi:hypothetical protein
MTLTTFRNNAKFYVNNAGTAATITKNPSLGYIDMQYRVGVEKISDAYSHSFISLGGQKTYGKNFARKKIGEDVPWNVSLDDWKWRD